MGQGSYWEIIIHPSDCVELFADFLMERTSCAIEYLDTTSPFAIHYDESSWHTPKAFENLSFSPSLFQHINATQPTQLILRIESSTPFEINKEAGKADSEAVSESIPPVVASVAKQSIKMDSKGVDCHEAIASRNDSKAESNPHTSLESKTDSETAPAERHALSAIESSFSSKPCSEQALKASSGWGQKNDSKGEGASLLAVAKLQTHTCTFKPLPDRACEPTPTNSKADSHSLESSLKHDTQSASASFDGAKRDLPRESIPSVRDSDISEANNKSLENDLMSKRSALISQTLGGAAEFASASQDRACELTLANSEDIILSCLRYAATLTDNLALDKPVTFCYHIERKANRDWIKAYEDSITPVVCGRFYIHPPWCAPHADVPILDSQINACSLQNLETNPLDSNAPDSHILESCALDSQPIESRLESQASPNSLLPIAINPALAFGSGHHASTRMCLELLGDLELEGRAVLDVGCGSGILGIAASKLGAIVEACDTDEFALQETRKNFESNATALEASWLGSINHSSAHYDVIIANIIAFVITLLHDDFATHLKKGGILILSGILDEYKSDIMRTFSDFTLLEARSTEGWSALKLTL